MYDTHRKSGRGSASVMLTRFATCVPMPAWSSSQRSYCGPRRCCVAVRAAFTRARSASEGGEDADTPQSACHAAASCGLSSRKATGSVSGSMLSTGSASKLRSCRFAGGGSTVWAWLSIAGTSATIRAMAGSISGSGAIGAGVASNGPA